MGSFYTNLNLDPFNQDHWLTIEENYERICQMKRESIYFINDNA